MELHLHNSILATFYVTRWPLCLLFSGSLSLGCSSPKETSVAPVCPSAANMIPMDPASGLCIAKNLTWLSDRRMVTAQMADLGAKIVRSDILWHVVQPEEETWDWSIPDDMIAAATENHLEFIPMLGYGVPWASSQTDSDPYYPPDDPNDFALFAGQVAERYKGTIQRYEIWNEPNAGYRFWKPDIPGDGIAYGALFLAAEQAIHTVDPTAQVIIGGTFFHEQLIPGTINFIGEMLSAHPEIVERADGIAVHPYTLYPPRVAPEEDAAGEIPVQEMIRQLRELTGALPILVTEMGWPSWEAVTEQNQADWLAREMLLLQAAGISDLCWYTLADDEEPSNPEGTFGLTREDGSYKPSGEAFANLAEKAIWTDEVGLIEDLPEGIWGVSYGQEGSAFWGTGELCGTTLGATPTWIESTH